jgi:hypothetical protein
MFIAARPFFKNGLTHVQPYQTFICISPFAMFSKGVKIDKGDPKKFNLVQRKVDRAEKMSPTIREDLDSQL